MSDALVWVIAAAWATIPPIGAYLVGYMLGRRHGAAAEHDRWMRVDL